MSNPVMNLGHLLTQTANLHPNRPALTQGDLSYTYRQLNQRVDAMAEALMGLGLAKGDRVLVQSRNVPQMFESMWAIFKAGLCWAPVNFRMAPGEVAFQGADCDAAAFIYEEPFQVHADAVAGACSNLKAVICIGEPRDSELSYDNLVEQNLGVEFQELPVSYDDMLWLFYTSGTTGRPKGIRRKLSGGPIDEGEGLLNLVTLLYGMTEETMYLSPAPLYHAAPLRYNMSVQRIGGTCIVMDHFDPERALQLIEKHKITHSQWVPTMFVRMLKMPRVEFFTIKVVFTALDIP